MRDGFPLEIDRGEKVCHNALCILLAIEQTAVDGSLETRLAQDYLVCRISHYAEDTLVIANEVHELSGCASVTQMFTSCSHLESVFATSFDNSSITSYTSVLYGCNRLVGGTGYVPTSTAGKNNLVLDQAGQAGYLTIR